MCEFLDSTDFIFNTNVHQRICIEGIDGNKILKQSNNIMKDFENKLSFYKEDSEISKINKNAGKEFSKVSSDTFNIIKLSKFYSNMTNGLFDVTIAPLVKEWRINSLSPNVPSEEKIKEIIKLINYNDIIVDDSNLSVKLLREYQKIDLGGIAKGYIADRLIEFYKENNVKSAIVNLGGNIKVLGRKSEEELWNVGIYYPKKNSNNIVCSLQLEGKSIVTSGAYERAFIYNNNIYHHILNPITGKPCETDLKSITIISDSSLEGDALSTPIFIMGKYKASEFMKKYNISGVMITKDDEIIITKDLIKQFSLMGDYKVLAF